MRELNQEEVRVSGASKHLGLEGDIAELTIRYDGWMEILCALEALSLEEYKPYPSPPTQRVDAYSKAERKRDSLPKRDRVGKWRAESR